MRGTQDRSPRRATGAEVADRSPSTVRREDPRPPINYREYRRDLKKNQCNSGKKLREGSDSRIERKPTLFRAPFLHPSDANRSFLDACVVRARASHKWIGFGSCMYVCEYLCV